MREKLYKNTILFIVGFCLYITIEVLFRGYSYPLMGVCGGLAGVIIDKINSRISWDLDILIQCTIGMLVITSFEMIIGLIFLNTSLIPHMWDYSNMILNYKGIICVPFMIAWFLISFLAIFVADSINYYVFGELPTPYYKLFGRIIIRFHEKK